MSEPRDINPVVLDMLARKARRRAELAHMSFGEKIALMEALRARLTPFKRVREARRTARRTAGTGVD
jgi:hypothetical protein